MPMVRVWIRGIVGFVGGLKCRLPKKKEDGFGMGFVEMSWFSIWWECVVVLSCVTRSNFKKLAWFGFRNLHSRVSESSSQSQAFF